MSDNNAAKKPHGEKVSPGFAHEETHKHVEEEGGEGNWLVSYADMMTLLVGFFAILLSFSSMDPEKFDEIKKSITKEFGGAYQVPYKELAEHIRDVAKKLGIGDQLLIKESNVGIEIYSRGTVFFDTGSADIKPEARDILKSFIEATRTELGQFDITVEGHTDDVPLIGGKQIRNNWELSSLRACRVLDAFITEGFPKDRLTAVGYGEARPLMPNRGPAGEAISDNQAQNRRVVIKLTEHPNASLEPMTEKAKVEAPADGAASGDATAAPAASAGATTPAAATGPAPASVETKPETAPAAAH